MWYRTFFNLCVCVSSVSLCGLWSYHRPSRACPVGVWMLKVSRLGSLMRSLFFFSNLSFRSNGPFPMSVICSAGMQSCGVQFKYCTCASYRLPFSAGRKLPRAQINYLCHANPEPWGLDQRQALSQPFLCELHPCYVYLGTSREIRICTICKMPYKRPSILQVCYRFIRTTLG